MAAAAVMTGNAIMRWIFSSICSIADLSPRSYLSKNAPVSTHTQGTCHAICHLRPCLVLRWSLAGLPARILLVLLDELLGLGLLSLLSSLLITLSLHGRCDQHTNVKDLVAICASIICGSRWQQHLAWFWWLAGLLSGRISNRSKPSHANRASKCKDSPVLD
ncbi:hypothetical protein BC831DRAFT_4719 [Entophlyctis helioformis]|nr:hypothetical protein BC831DRAFT_4719 [Entophlyctis helioformis]